MLAFFEKAALSITAYFFAFGKIYIKNPREIKKYLGYL